MSTTFNDSNGKPLERRQKYIVKHKGEVYTGTFHGDVDERNGYPIISTVAGGIAIGPECTITPAPIATRNGVGQVQGQVAQ